MKIKKSLIMFSIISAFGMQAYAQASSMNTQNNQREVPATTSLDKKIVKESDKTNESLEKGKISSGQAQALDKNQANIAKDLSDAKQDGDLTRDEKKHIKKEINNNQDMRDDMKKSNKDYHK